MFVIPKPGLSFRDPHSQVRVPQEGMEVPDGSLEWARIIADGDAEVGEPPVEAAAPAPSKTKTPAASGAADGSEA